MLPFTHAQFLEVFAAYNASVWPAQVVAYALAAIMLFLLVRWPTAAGRPIAYGLAAMWLWTGVAYHALHFSSINRAAYLFAALFIVQGLLFLRAAARNEIALAFQSTPRAWLGSALLAYATIVYPLLGIVAGPGYPSIPMFGITPCPVTLFTFGLLLLATRPLSRRLLVIPVVWSLIGGSAAFLLMVPQDWVLLLAGLSVIPLVRMSARPMLGAAAAR